MWWTSLILLPIFCFIYDRKLSQEFISRQDDGWLRCNCVISYPVKLTKWHYLCIWILVFKKFRCGSKSHLLFCDQNLCPYSSKEYSDFIGRTARYDLEMGSSFSLRGRIFNLLANNLFHSKYMLLLISLFSLVNIFLFQWILWKLVMLVFHCVFWVWYKVYCLLRYGSM